MAASLSSPSGLVASDASFGAATGSEFVIWNAGSGVFSDPNGSPAGGRDGWGSARDGAIPALPALPGRRGILTIKWSIQP